MASFLLQLSRLATSYYSPQGENTNIALMALLTLTSISVSSQLLIYTGFVSDICIDGEFNIDELHTMSMDLYGH